MTITTATTTPSRAPFAGFAAQLALIALLAGTTGLTLAGGIAGIAYGLVLCGLLGTALDRAGMTFLGWANLVTFSRAILTGGVTALVTSSVLGHEIPVWLLVTIATWPSRWTASTVRWHAAPEPRRPSGRASTWRSTRS